MILASFTIWDAVQFARKSRQLDLLSRGDYSPIADEFRAAYPNTTPLIRAIPFVQRYIDELTGLYARPVVRVFSADDVSVDAVAAKKLAQVYQDSKVNEVLQRCEAQLWTQNTVLLIALPDGPGKVRLQPIMPWQIVDIVSDDPLRADDPLTWSKLTAQVPAAVVSNQVTMGEFEITRTTASRDIGGKRVGIYAADKTHTFGRIPVVVCHRVAPDLGRALAPVNEAVLNLQICLSLQDADNELIVKMCAWPQKWIKNAGLAQASEEINIGPDKVLSLIPTGDPARPAPELAIAQGQVPVSELVSFIEHKIRIYCTMLNLDPSSFLKINTAVTASARLFSAQDRATQRDKILPKLAQLENDVASLIAQVLNVTGVMRLPDNLQAQATYTLSEPEPDPQSAAQTRALNIASGVDSPVVAVMQRDGVTRAEALKTVKKNLAESKALGLNPEPQPPAAPMVAAPAITEAQPVLQ